MSVLPEIKINRFDGGIVNDPRNPNENICRVVTNFDVTTNPRKMTPHYDSESGDSAASTSQKQNFCVALRTGSTYQLYSLGVKSGTGLAEVLYKGLTTGATTDLADNLWTNTNNNQASSGAASFGCFVYYKKTGYIYGGSAGRYIWRYDPSGSGAWVDTHADLTSFTTIAQGLVHSKDDILYIPYDNKIASNNNTNWTVAALTLPSNYKITSIYEDGNYLAIVCAPIKPGVENSKLFLWDRDSTVTTLADSIDLGAEDATIGEKVDGVSFIISKSGGDSTRFKDRIVFRYISGNVAVKFLELQGTTSSLLPAYKQRINSRLFFQMSISLAGTVREGVWSIGRSSISSPFSLVHERTPNNNTALSSGTLTGFFYVGDYLFQSYTSSSAFALSKTNDSASYTATSIYESKIFDNGDNSITKKILGTTVTTEPLPSGGQVVLKYKKDNESSFTTIFTNATVTAGSFIPGTEYTIISVGTTDFTLIGASASTVGVTFVATGAGSGTGVACQIISHSAINIESDGITLPEYKEIQFRIESTGGAEITGFSFKSESVNRRIY